MAHDEDWAASGTCRLVTCGYSNEYSRAGDTNVSDALTKPLDEKRMTNLLTMMGYVFRGGRTALAPEAQ